MKDWGSQRGPRQGGPESAENNNALRLVLGGRSCMESSLNREDDLGGMRGQDLKAAGKNSRASTPCPALGQRGAHAHRPSGGGGRNQPSGVKLRWIRGRDRSAIKNLQRTGRRMACLRAGPNAARVRGGGNGSIAVASGWGLPFGLSSGRGVWCWQRIGHGAWGSGAWQSAMRASPGAR